MPKEILKFPKDFLWGAASSAYQTEGGINKNDWCVWEKSSKRQDFLRARGKNPDDFCAGAACDFWNRYEEDFTLAQELNHNATRFGLEWSRIEPEEGKFDEDALDHYEKILQSAKFHGLTVFLTLHHYTLPLWLAKKGGFLNRKSSDYFCRYAALIADRLGEYVDFWITINEPEVYSSHSYYFQKYPPQEHSLYKTWRVVNNLIKAHNQAYRILKFKTSKPVSMAYQLSDLESSGLLSHFTHLIMEYLANGYVLRRTFKNVDFIGVNYYVHHHVGVFGVRHHSLTGHQVTDLGWGIHPEGLERVLLSLKKYQKPLYITENGLADAKDMKREKYIKDHLYHVHRAIQQGADVRSYLYWSLTDNFEWAEGFWPRFGLIEIDRDNMLRRKIRPSALKYAEICKSNILEI